MKLYSLSSDLISITGGKVGFFQGGGTKVLLQHQLEGDVSSTTPHCSVMQDFSGRC